MSREIITFQVGHYSNFVGAHWWNIQEASFCYDPKATEKHLIDHDVLFREGINPKGETTFTPRLISVDLRGSLGALCQGGTLYESPHVQSQPFHNWSGKIEVFKSEPEPSNEFISDLHKGEESYMSVPNGFDADKDVCLAPRGSGGSLATTPIGYRKLYDLTGSVKVWSDFLRPHLHPRSIVLVDGFLHNDESNPFDSFGSGSEVYKDQNFQENVEDTLRKTSEECSQLQGFHVLLDAYDGFAGVSSELLRHLTDEYSNKIVSAFPLCLSGYGRMDRASEVHRLLTLLFCLESICENTSIFSLLNLGCSTYEAEQMHRKFPSIRYQPDQSYHSSSILATALETLTLPLRTKTEPTSMVENIRLMTPAGRKCTAVSVHLPFEMDSGKSLSETLESKSASLMPLTPALNGNMSSVVQNFVLSGIPTKRYHSQSTVSPATRPMEEILVNSLRRQSSAQINSVNLISAPCYIPSTFPNILDRQDHSENSESMSVLLGCHNTNSSAHLFRHLISQITSLNVKRFQQFFHASLEQDDLTEIAETLTTFAERYDPSLFKG